MKSPTHFLFKEQWKLLATLVVAGFYLFFWLHGPLAGDFGLLKLEQEESEFSTPGLIGAQKKNKNFGTVGSMETEGFGHSLILPDPESSSSFGVIAKKSIDLNGEHAERMILHAKTLLPGTSQFLPESTGSLSYVSVLDDKKKLYFESHGVSDDIRGYAGPIHIGVFVNENGTIASVHHISSSETESYLRKIKNSGYYQQFTGLKMAGGQQVDAVSGATLTSEAIAKTATALLGKATPEPLTNFADVTSMSDFHVEARLSSWWILHITVIFLLFLYGFQKKLRKSKKGVLMMSGLSVVYIGFFLNNSFTYISFIHPFLGTSISSLIGIYALFALLGAIWGKNTYCKYVCPYGNVQRLLLHVAPKKMSSKFSISNKWVNRIRGIITLVLICGVMLGLRSWSNYEPFPDLFGFGYLTLWFFAAVSMVLISVKYPMIWCRLLCPTGSVLDFIGEAVNYKRKR